LALWIYTAAFLIAFLLYLLVYGRTLPVLGPGLLAAAAVAFGLCAAAALVAVRRARRTVHRACISTARRERARHEPLPEVIGRSTIWPQLVVTLMASRVLASDCDLSFVEFWRSDRLTAPSSSSPCPQQLRSEHS